MGFFNNQRTVIFLVCLIFFHLRFGIYNDFAVNAADGVKRGRGIYYNDETYGVVPFKNQGTGVVIDARWIKFANRGSAEFWSEYVHVREKLFLGIDEHGNKIDVAAELKRLEDLVLPLIAQFQLDHPPSSPSSENGVLVIYEPITDALFYSFIDECLAEAPVDGECTKWASKNDFGTMPNWNTRYVTDMAGMDTTTKGFNGRSRFDGDISKWDVSSVTNMRYMFNGARAFNQPISNWVVSSVKNMEQMFANTRAFNQPIGIWDVSSVTNMGHMFGQNRVFNQDISKWSGKAATSSQSSMFYDATAFKIKYSCADSNNGPVSTCACIKCIPAASFKTFIADCLQEAPIDGLCTTWASNNKPYGTMPNWETDFVLDMSSAFKDKTQFKGDISNWDVSKVTNMSEMFYNAADFNSDISSWDVSKVTNMSEMFYNAASFYRDLTKWTGPAATSSAQVNMFFGATAFRAKFTSCDYSQNHPANSCYCPNCIPDASFHSFVDECLAEAGAEVTGECTTWAAEKLAIDGKNYGTMPNWDTSIVRDMSGRLSKGPWTTQGFGNKHSFNGDISQWDTSSAKNMHSMFFKALAFNADISRWDVSSVTTMNSMFFQASAFDKDISKWLGPAAISEQADMFSGATQFQETFSCANARNGPASSCVFPIPSSESFKIFIDECLTLALNDGLCTTWSKVSMYGTMPNWGTRSVTDMSDAFKDKASFNGDISKWDTSNVLNMTNMFYGASAFNKDISKWDTSNVSNMESMFYGASAFNRDISKWDTSSVSNMGSMFYGASAFNKNISGWKGPAATTTAQTNMFFGATAFNLRYTCVDGIVSGCSCPKCIPAASFKTFVTDCLAEASVTGECDYWASDKPYGTMPSWDTSLVRDMSSTFMWKWDFNADISNWDVSQVENMQSMFNYAYSFNQPIGSWDVSQVTTMDSMFQSAYAFNQPIGSWDVSQVTTMQFMFNYASAFNKDISGWKGPAATTTAQTNMFFGATAFNLRYTCVNGTVSECSCPKCIPAASFKTFVTDCLAEASVTGDCTTWASDKPYGTMPSWDTFLVRDMSSTFYGNGTFNTNISNWDVSQVENMQSMFNGASAFNRDISKWDTSSVSNMESMFYGASAFNKNISGWKGPAATTTAQTNMFFGATAFNLRYTCVDGIVRGCSCPKCIPAASFKTFVHDCLAEASVTGDCTTWASDKPYGTMPSWDTSLVRDMSSTFFWKGTFNADISNWDVSQVENMEWMFNYASAFNQPIGSWDVSQVTHMEYMFQSASAFNQPIGSWDVSQVTTMQSMFSSASAFNQDISTWTGLASRTTQYNIFFGATAFQAKFTCKNVTSGPLSSCSVTPGKSVESAVNSVSELVGQPSGTYWINLNGTPTEIYCDLETDGGGWMSFASSPATGGWFTGNTATSWLGLSYTYGTYLPSGDVGDYWRDFSAQTEVDQVLFKTGDGQYWIVLNLADLVFPQDVVYYSANDPTNGLLAMVASSGNFAGTAEENTKAYYLYRTGSATDPYINAGNAHAVGNNYMLWGETHSVGSESHHAFKNLHGGVLLFVRQAPS